jgi:ABC-type transporter MlaC component
MRLFLVLGMCVSLLWGIGATQAGAGEPTAAVKAVLDRAMEIQTRADLSGEAKRAERVRLIRRLIVDSFAFAEMARETIKDRWDHISPGQRSEFQNLFSDCQILTPAWCSTSWRKHRLPGKSAESPTLVRP